LSAEKSLAIVIRLADFSESSRVVTLFTRDFGKISAVAKGAKRLRGPFEAALDLLAACEVVFLPKSSGGLDILTQAKLQQRFTPAAGHLGHLYAGYYLAELIDATCETHDAHPRLFDHSLACLKALSTSADLFVTLTRFEMVLLRETGHLPDMSGCASCGAAAEECAHAFFVPASGGWHCQHCGGHEARGPFLSGEALRSWIAILAHPEESNPVRDLPPRLRGEIRTVMNLTIANVLGRKPRTLRYLPL
jgi:DNA repair protein RecO (recombination protein O)